MAAKHGYLDVAKLLLEGGANPSVADLEGRRPIHQATRSASLAVSARLFIMGMPLLSGQAKSTSWYLYSRTGGKQPS